MQDYEERGLSYDWKRRSARDGETEDWDMTAFEYEGRGREGCVLHS